MKFVELRNESIYLFRPIFCIRRDGADEGRMIISTIEISTKLVGGAGLIKFDFLGSFQLDSNVIGDERKTTE